MPYTSSHKSETRSRIVEAARILFNRNGFSQVTIDDVMAQAGLTRGGFYNHFQNKEELYSEAVASFLNGRGKTWRDDAGVDAENGGPDTVRAMINSYLSAEHARDVDGQCPMIALPSDIARAGLETRRSYEALLRAMIWLYEHNLPKSNDDKRTTACVLAAISVGGMVLSRTLDDDSMASEIREAARCFAIAAVDSNEVSD
ncbi:MAG: TetR/AcrR family transcriptional regulator [Gammaproteobacteria bacterium]|nr:TetR/AcrR family transcriptional regulator [Gammaproteobacteria bacterium]